jgi:KaiC/GvpD/RAD55 family RecA-like ATPase
MLGGGYYRGASVLITGFPGTAKTTLSGAFAAAACRRGERTMFVSCDSDGAEVVRNLASVDIGLDRYVKNGCLRMVSGRTIIGSAETFLVRIKTLATEHRARCIVIDPVSTLSSSGNELTAYGVAERLIDWSKAMGTTLVCTSLLDEVSSQAATSSPLQISKMADTWTITRFEVSSKATKMAGSLQYCAPCIANCRAKIVLPEPGPPTSSVVQPRGRPPPQISSKPVMPVGALDIFATRVRNDFIVLPT